MDSWSSMRSKIDLIEDPVTSAYTTVTHYEEIYGKILETLDGELPDSSVKYFFELSRINNTLLLFRNDVVRNLFMQEAEELKLIPTLKEIHEGEALDDKTRRQIYESIDIPTNNEDIWANVPEDVISDNVEQQKLDSAMKRLVELQSQLSDCPKKNIKIQKKIANIQKILNVE